MNTPHIRPLAVAFGKARRLAGTSNDSTERECVMWTRQTERHDLDAWAKALGVRTDDDAYNALERLQVQLQDISSSLRALREKITGTRTSTGSDIEADMDEASARTMYAADGLGSVMTSFDRHERGGF